LFSSDGTNYPIPDLITASIVDGLESDTGLFSYCLPQFQSHSNHSNFPRQVSCDAAGDIHPEYD